MLSPSQTKTTGKGKPQKELSSSLNQLRNRITPKSTNKSTPRRWMIAGAREEIAQGERKKHYSLGKACSTSLSIFFFFENPSFTF
jgi:hypothetical protein